MFMQSPGLRSIVVQTEQHEFPNAVRQALPSVVSLRSIVPDDAYTADILGTERTGYGVIIRKSGLILTIGYLTAEAETIWITTSDGQALPGHVIAYDFETGFGLVQVLARVDLPAIPIGRSGAAKIGDEVVVAGGGAEPQIVAAKIVARQAFAGYWEYAIDDALFTFPAHPHWGGTAVINLAGELIGIGSLLVQSAGEDDDADDINMVVPVDLLEPRLESLLTTGRADDEARPWLGVFATEVSDQVVIVDVAARGPADQSDVGQGDVVLAVGGVQVEDLGDFYRRVWALGPAGVDVPLLISRDGDTMTIHVRSADRNSFLKAPMTH